MRVARHLVVRCPHTYKWRVKEEVGSNLVSVNARDVIVFSGDYPECALATLCSKDARRYINSVTPTSVVALHIDELVEAFLHVYDELSGRPVVKLVVHGDDDVAKGYLLENVPENVRLAPRCHERVLTVECVDSTYYLGATADEDSHEERKAVVSRAYWKLAEAATRWPGLPLGPGSKVVDVGAAPGGWSQYCLDAGCDLVVAIDPSALLVPENGRLRHVRKRVEDTRDDLRGLDCQFDACVCDANCHPRFAIRSIVQTVVPFLKTNAVLVLTLKQPNGVAREDTLAELVAQLRDIAFVDVKVAWLWANRKKERTLYACRANSAEPTSLS